MKKKYVLFALMATAILGTSCNKEWTEEQYEHYVSFRSPLNDQGTTNIYVPYTRKKDGVPLFGMGKSSYQLPIIVSGSTTNQENLTVHVAHHPDTLVALNQARYSTRTDLYYKDMGSDQFSFVSFAETAKVNAGERTGLLNLDFDFNNIDMSDKWVLPLQVVDNPSYGYQAHPRKNYSKALLRIFPFNNYSGDYKGGLLTFKVVDESTGQESEGSITRASIRGYVVDENTIFTYAGMIDEEYTDRKTYKIKIKFIPGEIGGMVELSCDNASEIGFAPAPGVTPSYQLINTMDAVQPYLMHRFVIINNIDYYFNHLVSDNSYVRYHVKGTLALSRNINTQIPDEDQAIEW